MSYRQNLRFKAIGLEFEANVIVYPGEQETRDQPGYDDELEFDDLFFVEDTTKTDASYLLGSTVADDISEGAWAAIAKIIASDAEDAAIAAYENEMECRRAYE